MRKTSAVVTGDEIDLLVEALELALGDYEEGYWQGESHDSPEEWVMARDQYKGFAGLYVKFTGQKWRGSHHWWDEAGPSEIKEEGG